MKLPCLIVAFSRTKGIESLLASLDPSQISALYVAIDGPTSPAIRTMQIKIHGILQSFSTQNNLPLKIWQRSINLGVAKSVISAIDWFFSHIDYGIILEDDLVVGKDFFGFVGQNMGLLDSIDDLLLISGNQFIQNDTSGRNLNWTNYPLIWGWATSGKRWTEMRLGILDTSFDLSHNLFSAVTNFWRVGALRVRSLKLDTWDIPLANHMLSQKKLCLTPNVNLVSNRGADIFAAHTSSDQFPLNLPTETLDSFIVSQLPSENDLVLYNHFLEKMVFKIKTRHRFVYFYFLLTRYFRPDTNSGALSQALTKIEIPSDT